MIKHVSAGGVVFNTNLDKVYLIHKIERDEWNLPKGHLEQGETSLDTAKREIKEETGLSDFVILGSSPTNIVSYKFINGNGKNEKTVYFFSAIALSDEACVTQQMADEGLDGAWFEVNEAIAIVMSETAETIKKSHETVLLYKN